MVVVDTLSWIEMLRPDGRKDVRERVNGHLRRLVAQYRHEFVDEWRQRHFENVHLVRTNEVE